MITIPTLSDVTDILDTDQVMVTNAQGQSYKIAGSELNKRHKVIIADSTTVTGTPLKEGWPVRICFTADITAANASTTMQINYNNVNYYVKVPKNGALENYVAFNLGGSPAVFKYVQAYTTLELLFDGTQFIIMCNPVVISGTNFSIYADGLKRVDEVTENGTDLVTSHAVAAAIDKVKDIMGSLPTDAVLHYSFDEVPDYPDGTADVRLINSNSYDIQSTSYKFYIDAGGTVSNENGNAKITGSGNNSGVRIEGANLLNKIIKLKIKITELSGNLTIAYYSGTLFTFDKVGTYEVAFMYTYTGSYNSLYFHTRDTFTATIEAIYIGDGSYSTPIINNANGQYNATNNGGIATKGVSGKGALFFDGKYADIGNYNLADNFSISLWIKPSENESGKIRYLLFKSGVIAIQNGYTNNNFFYVNLTNPTNNNPQFITTSSLLQKDVYNNVICTKNGTNFIIYINSVKVKTQTVDAGVKQNANNLTISSSSNNVSQSIDDLLIFDRALTENEVMALYLNKANTPKYYPPAQLPS